MSNDNNNGNNNRGRRDWPTLKVPGEEIPERKRTNDDNVVKMPTRPEADRNAGEPRVPGERRRRFTGEPNQSGNGRSAESGRNTQRSTGSGRGDRNGNVTYGTINGPKGMKIETNGSKREWILAAVGIALLLIVIIFVAVVILHGDEPELLPSSEVTSKDYPTVTYAPRPTATPMPTTYKIDTHEVTVPDYVVQDFIEPNEFSRPQDPLPLINNIAVHYVGNPNTSGAANANYFKSLGDPKANPDGHKASSHFVIGMEGEVIQCIPLWEICYATNSKNVDTVAIECCHPAEDGKFTEATYNSLIDLLAHLCAELELDPEEALIRHYDVTGKSCPKYYVDHEDEWLLLKQDVKNKMIANGTLTE